VGSTMAGLSGWLHVLLAIVIATASGAVFAGIAGLLKATVGAHEVITTIMLNWIAVWAGQYLFGLGGPLQSSTEKFIPIAIDILGWQYRISPGGIRISSIGFIGIAVALLGRNTAIGTFLAALLFGALLTGTSNRNLPPDVFRADLAGNLTQIIQGLVVLFV